MDGPMTMTIVKNIILKIGTKGEIFPPKEVREKLGFLKDQPIIMTVHGDQLIIRKLHSIESILKEPAKVTISQHAWKHAPSYFLLPVAFVKSRN